MLPAWIEPFAGNQGMISASGMAIAVAITPITTICRIGRLRTVVLSLRALGRHSPAS